MLFVSMVMAVFNGERFLKETIDHALVQTYPFFEIIIVNDGSTDSTKFIIDEIRDSRVKGIHLEKNQGAANALNIGIEAAKGNWIAIQDADDISYPNRIEEQVNYILEHPKLVGIGTFIRCISGDEDIPDEAYNNVAEFKNGRSTKKQIREIIYWGCPFTHSSVMFSKQSFQLAGGYDTRYKIAYDYDLWLKLLELGDMEIVPKVLLDYRMHQRSLSNSDGLETLNEVQIASARAVNRTIMRKREHQARVILFGPQRGCEHFAMNIAPLSGLQVMDIFQYERKNVNAAIKKLKAKEADVIIILNHQIMKSLLLRLRESKLKFNRDFYLLHNYLE